MSLVFPHFATEKVNSLKLTQISWRVRSERSLWLKDFETHEAFGIPRLFRTDGSKHGNTN